jgi:hypothetical protein
MSEQGTPTAIIHLGDTKHIEPGKTYSIEVEQLVPLDGEAVKNIIQTFEQATGAKAVVIHKSKVNNSGVVTMPVEELRKLTQAVARVRELHRPMIEVNENGFENIVCAGCWDEDTSTGQEFHHSHPCPTIKALDGTYIPTESPCADGDFCKVVNGRIKHDRFCDNINHRDED